MESVLTMGVDPQDIVMAGSELVGSLISSGVLKNGRHKPARIIFEGFTNDTATSFPTAWIFDDMQRALTDSGLAVIEPGYSTTRRGRVEDPADFVLTGQVTEQRQKAGRMKRFNYYFGMKLIDPTTLEIVWNDMVNIQKSGRF